MMMSRVQAALIASAVAAFALLIATFAVDALTPQTLVIAIVSNPQMKDAISFHRDGLKEEGISLPEPRTSSSYVEVPV